MKRNQRILIAAGVVALIIIIGYYFWNGSRIVTGNTLPHTKTQIAYMANCSRDLCDIYIFDVATGSVTQLTMNSRFLYFRWSPDGEALILTELQFDNNTNISNTSDYQLNVSTAELKPVSAELANTRQLEALLSPDGKQILYSFPHFVDYASIAAHYSIYIKSMGKDDKQKVANGLAPAWSPDGTQIAFTSQQANDADTELYVMNRDGSNQRRLLQNLGVDDAPTWSFDGQYIAFHSTAKEQSDTYPRMLSITDNQGKAPVTVGEMTSLSARPVWSPTANQIAFSNVNNVVCIVDADGGNSLCPPDQKEGFSPDWSPDGTQLVFDDGQKLCVFILKQKATSCFNQAVGGIPLWRP